MSILLRQIGGVLAVNAFDEDGRVVTRILLKQKLVTIFLTVEICSLFEKTVRRLVYPCFNVTRLLMYDVLISLFDYKK